MDYRFYLTYTPTDGEPAEAVQVFPLWNDELSVVYEKESGEWYHTKKLDGQLTFVRRDYQYIMGCAFDGSFRLTIEESHDYGVTWEEYMEGVFSRASLEIDEDNQKAVLNGLSEGAYDWIKNGKSVEYDLMKIVPDSELKEVKNPIPPALALVDECSEYKVSFSDLYAGAPFLSGGYIDSVESNFWGINKDMRTNPNGNLQVIMAEAEIVSASGDLVRRCSGTVHYATLHVHGAFTPGHSDEYDYYKTSLEGTLYGTGDVQYISMQLVAGQNTNVPYIRVSVIGGDTRDVNIGTMYRENTFYSPLSIIIDGDAHSHFKKVTISFHYIYTSLLAVKNNNRGSLNASILDTGSNYKYMKPFEGSSLTIQASNRWSEEPNGYKIIPGTNEPGQLLIYFAPPDDSGTWIPLAQDNWNYASFWYHVVPTTTNQLLSEVYAGMVSWQKCWTIGTCIKYLLDKITNHQVVFEETVEWSEFLYAMSNPVTGKYNYTYLVTQKSNVMFSNGSTATRCIVTLNWFLELLHNAFNCYYWMEKREDGRYDFKIEHVEYFRRGYSYEGTLEHQLDLTRLRPIKNFARGGRLVKMLSDQLNHYNYDLSNMVEKYTFAWQGEGGSDDFKGNPMFFKAGWIERGSSENHEVDNIFADLSWLMLNAGSNVTGARNYDGLFIFAGSRNLAYTDQWTPGYPAPSRYFFMNQNQPLTTDVIFNLTITAGHEIELTSWGDVIATYVGTGEPQEIIVSATDQPYLWFDFGNLANENVVINYVAYGSSNEAYQIAAAPNLLRNDGSMLQNGPLAWPWLQNDFLHYDIPAQKWSYDSDDMDEATFAGTGTVKLVKKQMVTVVPMLSGDPTMTQGVCGGLKDRNGNPLTGIIEQAKIRLASRNCEMTLEYDIVS